FEQRITDLPRRLAGIPGIPDDHRAVDAGGRHRAPVGDEGRRVHVVDGGGVTDTQIPYPGRAGGVAKVPEGGGAVAARGDEHGRAGAERRGGERVSAPSRRW